MGQISPALVALFSLTVAASLGCVAAQVPTPNQVTGAEPTCVVHGQRAVLVDVFADVADGVSDDGAAEEWVAERLPDGDLYAVTVRATPKGDGSWALDVRSPVAFQAHVKEGWPRLARDVTTEDGSVVLRRHARLVDVRPAAPKHGVAQVEARVALFSENVLSGENIKKADETLSTVVLPCDALTFSQPSAEEQTAASEVASGLDAEVERDVEPDVEDAAVWRASRTTQLRIASTPSESPVSSRVLATKSSTLKVLQLAEHGDGAWVRVRAQGEHVTVEGWVKREALEPEPLLVLIGRPICLCGREPIIRDVPSVDVSLRKGAKLFHADGRVFATVVEDMDARITLLHRKSGSSMVTWTANLHLRTPVYVADTDVVDRTKTR